ncbi:MAG: hypothetical protein ACOC0J_00280 [Myxococcota bacterium]
MTVWLKDGADEAFCAPDGWKITRVYIASNNGTAVDVEREQ